MTDDTYGFGGTRKKLANITPRPPRDVHPESLRKTDAASIEAGFVPREAGARTAPRRQRSVGPTMTINTRVPVEIAERFIAFCDDNRLAYWEGIEELMKRTGI